MTLANIGAVDNHVITIKRYGTGQVGVTAVIDGTSTTLTMLDATIKEALTFKFITSLATYILI